jgi:signal transduction histidine kinase
MDAPLLALVGMLVTPLVLTAGYFGWLAWRERKHAALSDKRITELEASLADMRASQEKTAAALAVAQSNSVYEQYARPIVSQMDVGVIAIDQQKIIRLINTYAAQYLDFDAVVGKPYQEVVHLKKIGGSEDPMVFEAALGGTAQPIPEGYELASKRATIPIRGSIMSVTPNKPGGSIFFLFEDISKQSERERESNAFFSAAAHELRTPLTVIRMTVSLLKDKFETMQKDAIMEHYRRMEESSERLVKLVNDFLNVSRLAEGRIVMKTEPFDMVALTDEAVKEVSALAKERKLYIQHDPTSTEFRTVMGDRERAKEVLLNLLSNGIKYTMQGGLTVTHEASSAALATKVSDSGAGIQKEQQPLLFRRFSQVGGARSLSIAKSSGLGLYISKKFAQLMHGDVTLEKSEPGVGSTFVFSLPRG